MSTTESLRPLSSQRFLEKRPRLLEATNRPVWNPELRTPKSAFHETWYMKLNSEDSKTALWLRFTLLNSRNGFKRKAEIWAVLFEKQENGEVKKTALKESHDLKTFSVIPGGFRIGETEFRDDHTHGIIRSKGRKFSWDLGFENKNSRFQYFPESILKLSVVRNDFFTVGSNVVFNGHCSVDSKSIHLNNARGSQGHVFGPKNDDFWVWGHCNQFRDKDGNFSDFVFEGLTGKSKLARILPGPSLSSFFFHYDGTEYSFNSPIDLLRTRSHHSYTDWIFQADRAGLSFRGKLTARLKDFAGLTLEDTNGTFLFCSNSKICDMRVAVYRDGKPEAEFFADATAAYEITSREKNPYVPLLI